jgi:hypothetical protein
MRKVQVTLGIAAIGACLLAFNNSYIKVLGAVLTFLGGYFLYRINSVKSNSDKREIIEKIELFTQQIDDIKNSSSEKDTINKLCEVENEFSEWANGLKISLPEKTLEILGANIALEKRKIELSKKFRKYYLCFFQLLDTIIAAYNKTTTNKIEYVIRNELPINLYSVEAFSYAIVAKFSNSTYWWFGIYPSEPLDEEKIPSIILNVTDKPEKSLAPMWGDLVIRFNLKSKKIRVENERLFRTMTIEFNNNLDCYEEAFRAILKITFEFQLIVNGGQL